MASETKPNDEWHRSVIGKTQRGASFSEAWEETFPVRSAEARQPDSRDGEFTGPPIDYAHLAEKFGPREPMVSVPQSALDALATAVKPDSACREKAWVEGGFVPCGRVLDDAPRYCEQHQAAIHAAITRLLSTRETT